MYRKSLEGKKPTLTNFFSTFFFQLCCVTAPANCELGGGGGGGRSNATFPQQKGVILFPFKRE